MLSAVVSEATAQGPHVEVLAEYVPGNFLENLDVLSDGRVVFTSYFAKTIEIIDSRGRAGTLAHVSAHPVSILAIEGGFLIAAHGQPFTSGPAFVEAQHFLLLDAAGRELAMFKAPEARFLNGMVHSGATALVADSMAGKIWQVMPRRARSEPGSRMRRLRRTQASRSSALELTVSSGKGSTLLCRTHREGRWLPLSSTVGGLPLAS